VIDEVMLTIPGVPVCVPGTKLRPAVGGGVKGVYPLAWENPLKPTPWAVGNPAAYDGIW
jgi:hypothetical protein